MAQPFLFLLVKMTLLFDNNTSFKPKRLKCTFGLPIFKIAHLAPQVLALFPNRDPPLILTRFCKGAETWGVKCAILKIGGPRSQVCETWGAKSAFKP